MTGNEFQGTIYEETGKQVAALVDKTVDAVGNFLATCFIGIMAGIILALFFGLGGFFFGFIAVWVGVLFANLGMFLLMIAMSSVTGGVLAGLIAFGTDTPFIGWWVICTVVVVIIAWAKIIKWERDSFVPDPVVGNGLPQQRPAWIDDLEENSDLKYGG